MFCKKGALKNFTKFTGKHLHLSLFFIKVAGLRPVTLFKKRFWHRCFSVNFAKFLRAPFFMEHLRWLILRLYQILAGMWFVPWSSDVLFKRFYVCFKFFVKDLFIACDQIRRKIAGLVTFSEETLNEKLYFLCSAMYSFGWKSRCQNDTCSELFPTFQSFFIVIIACKGKLKETVVLH